MDLLDAARYIHPCLQGEVIEEIGARKEGYVVDDAGREGVIIRFPIDHIQPVGQIAPPLPVVLLRIIHLPIVVFEVCYFRPFFFEHLYRTPGGDHKQQIVMRFDGLLSAVLYDHGDGHLVPAVRCIRGKVDIVDAGVRTRNEDGRQSLVHTEVPLDHVVAVIHLPGGVWIHLDAQGMGPQRPRIVRLGRPCVDRNQVVSLSELSEIGMGWVHLRIGCRPVLHLNVVERHPESHVEYVEVGHPCPIHAQEGLGHAGPPVRHLDEEPICAQFAQVRDDILLEILEMHPRQGEIGHPAGMGILVERLAQYGDRHPALLGGDDKQFDPVRGSREIHSQ